MHGANTDYVIEPAVTPAIPVAGTQKLFPVHRVYCVGRNYAAHAVEMGHDPDKEPPFFFQKNPDDLTTGGRFPYPPASGDVHHEIEMMVALESGGKDIALAEALDCVYGYGVALDMTRRDLQARAIGHPATGAIWLDVNGERRQAGALDQMIWKVPEMIVYLSGLFTLSPGDIILSGTPAGVGPVRRGDVLKGHVDGVGELEVVVV